MRGLKTTLIATRFVVAAVVFALGLTLGPAAQDLGTRDAVAAPIDDQGAWSLGKIPEPGRGPATVRAVAAGPKGFVAVGETCPRRFGCNAAAWTSRDGRKWRVVDVDRAERAAGRSVGSSLFDVAWGPRGFIAVGESHPPWVDVFAGTGGPEPVAAVWRSKDGKRWRRTATGTPLSSNPPPSQVVASDAGYVALSPGRSKVMASRDGVKWAKRPPGRPGLTGAFAAVTPLAKGVAVLGPARVESAEGGRSRSSTIRRSKGADAWTPQVVAGEDSYLGRLAAIEDRVVVVGGPWMFDEYVVPHGGLTRAIDSDGRVVMGSVPGADGLYAVGAVGERFLVAGQACRPALWASDDGIAWKRVDGPGKLPKGAPRWYDVDIAANDDRVVLVGTAERPGPDRRSQRPRLVNFALSAPLSALDPAELKTDATCVMDAEMPIAQLTTPDGTTVDGLPTTSCWLGGDSAGGSMARCQDLAAPPPPAELPLVNGAGKRVPLKLTLSDGSAFSAASVVSYHVSGDITSAGALVSTNRCEPQREVDFEMRDGNSVLLAEITFGCGQGSSQYLFHFQPSGN